MFWCHPKIQQSTITQACWWLSCRMPYVQGCRLLPFPFHYAVTDLLKSLLSFTHWIYHFKPLYYKSIPSNVFFSLSHPFQEAFIIPLSIVTHKKIGSLLTLVSSSYYLKQNDLQIFFSTATNTGSMVIQWVALLFQLQGSQFHKQLRLQAVSSFVYFQVSMVISPGSPRLLYKKKWLGWLTTLKCLYADVRKVLFSDLAYYTGSIPTLCPVWDSLRIRCNRDQHKDECLVIQHKMWLWDVCNLFIHLTNHFIRNICTPQIKSGKHGAAAMQKILQKLFFWQ